MAGVEPVLHRRFFLVDAVERAERDSARSLGADKSDLDERRAAAPSHVGGAATKPWRAAMSPAMRRTRRRGSRLAFTIADIGSGAITSETLVGVS